MEASERARTERYGGEQREITTTTDAARNGARERRLSLMASSRFRAACRTLWGATYSAPKRKPKRGNQSRKRPHYRWVHEIQATKRNYQQVLNQARRTSSGGSSERAAARSASLARTSPMALVAAAVAASDARQASTMTADCGGHGRRPEEDRGRRPSAGREKRDSRLDRMLRISYKDKIRLSPPLLLLLSAAPLLLVTSAVLCQAASSAPFGVHVVDRSAGQHWRRHAERDENQAFAQVVSLNDNGRPMELSEGASTPAAADSAASQNQLPSDEHTDEFKIMLTIVYLIIFIIGVCGNVCNCLVIADSRNRYMKTATNYYLFSLSISDLLLLIFGLPHDIVNLWHPMPYLFGSFVCISRGWISEASTYASVLVIVAFTVERYLAICHPLKAHTLSRLSRSIKIIIIIWVVASSCALVVVWQFGIQETLVEVSVDASPELLYVPPGPVQIAATGLPAAAVGASHGRTAVAEPRASPSPPAPAPSPTSPSSSSTHTTIATTAPDNNSHMNHQNNNNNNSNNSQNNNNDRSNNDNNQNNNSIDSKGSSVEHKSKPRLQKLAQCTTVALNPRVFELSVIIFFIIPITIITILYIKLGHTLSQKSIVIKRNRLNRERHLSQRQCTTMTCSAASGHVSCSQSSTGQLASPALSPVLRTEPSDSGGVGGNNVDFALCALPPTNCGNSFQPGQQHRHKQRHPIGIRTSSAESSSADKPGGDGVGLPPPIETGGAASRVVTHNKEEGRWAGAGAGAQTDGPPSWSAGCQAARKFCRCCLFTNRTKLTQDRRPAGSDDSTNELNCSKEKKPTPAGDDRPASGGGDGDDGDDGADNVGGRRLIDGERAKLADRRAVAADAAGAADVDDDGHAANDGHDNGDDDGDGGDDDDDDGGGRAGADTDRCKRRRPDHCSRHERQGLLGAPPTGRVRCGAASASDSTVPMAGGGGGGGAGCPQAGSKTDHRRPYEVDHDPRTQVALFDARRRQIGGRMQKMPQNDQYRGQAQPRGPPAARTAAGVLPAPNDAADQQHRRSDSGELDEGQHHCPLEAAAGQPPPAGAAPGPLHNGLVQPEAVSVEPPAAVMRQRDEEQLQQHQRPAGATSIEMKYSNETAAASPACRPQAAATINNNNKHQQRPASSEFALNSTVNTSSMKSVIKMLGKCIDTERAASSWPIGGRSGA
jgi:hypothetical protein